VTESGRPESPERDLTATEHYFDWVYGEDGEIREAVNGTEEETSISFDGINNALEQGMSEGGRNEAISQGILEAAEQYTPQTGDTYEDIHRHTLSALHQTLQDENNNWDITIKSNINAVITDETRLPYTEIEVEQENGETDIVNAYIGREKGIKGRQHAARTPSDDQAVTGDDLSGTEDILNGIRDGENPTFFPSHDVGDAQILGEAGADEERIYDQMRVLSGMQIREGSYTPLPENGDISYQPDNLLVAQTNQDIERINQTKYENGDTSLVDALNDKYMDQYEDTEHAVRWTSTETEDGYEVEMWEDPDFSYEEEIAE
jgi:hypothetical protein